MASDFPRITKLLGFCPVSFVDDCRNIVDDYCADAVDAFEAYSKGVSRRPSDDLHTDGDAMLQRIREVSDCNMDKFEVYALRNLFFVPADLVLEGEAPQSTTASVITEADEQKVDQELAEMEARLQAARSRKRSLRRARDLLQRRLRGTEIKVSQCNFDDSAALDENKVQSIVSATEDMKRVLAATKKMRRDLGLSRGDVGHGAASGTFDLGFLEANIALQKKSMGNPSTRTVRELNRRLHLR